MGSRTCCRCIAERLPGERTDGSFLIQDITDLDFYSPSGEWLSHVFTHAGNWLSDHVVTGPETFIVKWHEFLQGDSFILRKFIASYDLEGDFISEFMTDSIHIPATPETNNDVLQRSFSSHYFMGDLNGNVYMIQRHSPDYNIIDEGMVQRVLLIDAEYPE